jgi:hypothetical protein
MGDAAETGNPLETCRARETGEAGGGDGPLETVTVDGEVKQASTSVTVDSMIRLAEGSKSLTLLTLLTLLTPN